MLFAKLIFIVSIMDEHFLARHGTLRTDNDAILLSIKTSYFKQWKFVSMKPRLYSVLHHVRPSHPSNQRKLVTGLRNIEQKEEIRTAIGEWEMEKQAFQWEFSEGIETVRRYIEEMRFPGRNEQRAEQGTGLKLVYEVGSKGYCFSGQGGREEETESVSWQTAYEE